MAQLQHWIWLTTRKGLTLRGQQLTLSYFGSPLAAYEASPEDIAAVPGLVDREREALAQKDLAYARATLELCSDQGIRILPVRTSSIHSGSLPLTVRRWCSIIGAPCWTLTSSRWSRWWAPGMPAPTVCRVAERWATRSVPARRGMYPARQRALTLGRWRVPWKPGAMWRRCWATDWISSIPSLPNPSIRRWSITAA